MDRPPRFLQQVCTPRNEYPIIVSLHNVWHSKESLDNKALGICFIRKQSGRFFCARAIRVVVLVVGLGRAKSPKCYSGKRGKHFHFSVRFVRKLPHKAPGASWRQFPLTKRDLTATVTTRHPHPWLSMTPVTIQTELNCKWFKYFWEITRSGDAIW